MKLDPYEMRAAPVIFWDIFGEKGHPVRATISEMGPLLLSRLMNLTDAQEGVLNIAFRLADEEGLLLLDLKDLQAILTEMAAAPMSFRQNTATSTRRLLGRSSVRFWYSISRAVPNSSANQPCALPTSCAQRRMGAAW